MPRGIPNRKKLTPTEGASSDRVQVMLQNVRAMLQAEHVALTGDLQRVQGLIEAIPLHAQEGPASSPLAPTWGGKRRRRSPGRLSLASEA